ncbi:MAG: protein arginine kinase [Bacillota bacterium]
MSTEKQFKLSKWISDRGPEKDIVLSSRVRLARNLQDFPYPNQADSEDLIKIENLLKEITKKNDKLNLHYIEINRLPDVERQLLVEKNLTSPAHVENGKGKGVLLNDEENVSIMVNEEDHLRTQVLLPGLQLDETWEKADFIDDILEEQLDFAFSEKWGYLSACPTNLGTGLRASVMVHLPGLNMTNNINKMLGAISQLGLVVRGIYGEGSESAGNIYQISNQITLGNTEEDIIDNLKSVTTQIIEEEKNARKRLLQEQEIAVKDEIMRSFGTLKYAYKMSSKEAMKLLSNVSLGINMGIIDDIDSGILSELLILIRPAHLQKKEGKELDHRKRDVIRANLIQEWLNIE